MKAPSFLVFLTLGLILSYFWPDALKVMIAAWVLWNVGLFFRHLIGPIPWRSLVSLKDPPPLTEPLEIPWVCEICNLEMDKVTTPAGYQVWRCPNFKSCHQWQPVEEMQN